MLKYYCEVMMKTIIINDDNLMDQDVEEVVTRTKGLIINSDNEINLVYSHLTYQFPGGHLIEGESLGDCLVREIEEETGITLNNYNLTPFMEIVRYTKNYRNEGKNRKNIIWYYIINTDAEYNKKNTHPDEWEIDGNIEVKKIPLNEIENVLTESSNDNEINKTIVREMLDVIKEYKKEYMDEK
jgi:8-oxo-dGTP pyrophosphatase MutT (NUDIX family)